MEIDFTKLQEAVDKHAEESRDAFNGAMNKMMQQALEQQEAPYSILAEGHAAELEQARRNMEREAEAAAEKARQEVVARYAAKYPEIRNEQPTYKALLEMAGNL